MRADDRVRQAQLAQRQALANSDMALRWTAAGMLEAEQQFRRIISYADLAKLAVAIEHDLAATPTAPTQAEAATLATIT